MKHVLMFAFLLTCLHFSFANGPIATNASVSTPENQSILIPVTQYVVDPNGGQLTDSVIYPVLHGIDSIANVNQVLYTPLHGFYGIDSFIYKVCDTFSLCTTAKVYINVIGTGQPPVAANYTDTFSYTIADTGINVLINARDSANLPMSVTAVINPDSILGYLTLDTGGFVTFMHTPVSCGTDNFQYVICNYALCDTGQVTIVIACPGNFFLPQGFSPNGDGINDLLVFPQLGYFPNSSLKVFNRYGAIVYESSDYQNNWGGTDMDTNQPLPDGTYFYILQLNDGRNFNNYVVINR